MKMRKLAVLIAASAATPAAAEVKSSSAMGFELEAKVAVAASAADAYAALGRIHEWWDPQHSYSAKAGNLTLSPRAGGCFCEKLEGGGTVEHLRVVFARPGRMLRLQGGLGPLQAQAAAGTLTWTLTPLGTGTGTEISQSYAVAGYFPAGADKLAPLVDAVMTEQLQRLQRRLGAVR